MARSTQHVTSLKHKIRTYRQKWYYLPDNERAQLRQRYNNDKDAYFAAFRLDEDDAERTAEVALAAFIKLETRLLSTMQFDHYQRRAHELIQTILHGCTPDVAFVAIDFEGDISRRGVTELGLAKCDFQYLERGMVGTNIATARRNRRDYLLGNYMRIDIAQLPETIVSHLSDKQIILVGHSIRSELTTMKQFGVPIEALPHVVGIVDTFNLARLEIGHEGTLQSLMDVLHIPNEANTFHCGGNDAHYTMQAFLALLVHREEREGRQMGGIVGERLRELAWAKAPLKREMRKLMDECAGGRDLDEEGCGFGDLFGDVGE